MAEYGTSKRKGANGFMETVDKLFGVPSIYARSLASAFTKFQDPSSELLPPSHLFQALQYLFKCVTQQLDQRVGKVCLRPITEQDFDDLVQSDSTVKATQPLDIEDFDEIARKLLKCIAVERSKRLGIFMLGGMVAVHFLKGTLKKLPVIGSFGMILDIFAPTIVLGPVVGIAGAMHM